MIVASFRQVFGNVRYLFIAGGTALSVFALSAWLSNIKLLIQVIGSSTASVVDKLVIFGSFLGSIGTNFTLFSASYTIAIAIFFGINVAMFVYYIKRRREFVQQGGVATSLGGLVSGMFGIGCAACGTLVLAPLLALVGAGGIIAFLPFGGQEFGVLGVGMLAFSVVLTAKKIQDPLICAIEEPGNKEDSNLIQPRMNSDSGNNINQPNKI